MRERRDEYKMDDLLSDVPGSNANGNRRSTFTVSSRMIILPPGLSRVRTFSIVLFKLRVACNTFAAMVSSRGFFSTSRIRYSTGPSQLLKELFRCVEKAT